MPYKEHLRKSQLPMFIVLPDCIDTLLIWTIHEYLYYCFRVWYTIVELSVMVIL